MDLSLLRMDNLIERYKQLTTTYQKLAEDLEKFLKEFHQVRCEILLIEDELGKRKQTEKNGENN